MRIAVLIILFCVLLQSVSKGLLLIRYQVNKKFYSEVLCSNRGLIVIDCEGKCRLLQDVEEDEKRSKHIQEKETLDNSVLPPVGIKISEQHTDSARAKVFHASPLPEGWTSSIDKPPCFTFPG